MFRMIYTFVEFSSRKSAVPMSGSGFLLSLLFVQGVQAQVCLWYAMAIYAWLVIKRFRFEVVTPHLHKVITPSFKTKLQIPKFRKKIVSWINKYESEKKPFQKYLYLPSSV